MKLVVGLGNPGDRYRRHRHNVGFEILDQVARTNQVESWKSRFRGVVTDCWISAEKVVLLKPQTYMNKSGQSVREVVSFFGMELAELLVVCDDFNLPIGRLRLRAKGGSGGQKGLEDISRHLGAEEIPRLRVGIGDPGRQDPADYVLSSFPVSKRPIVEETIIDAGRAVECWCREGIEVAMNRFNARESNQTKE